MARGLVVAYSVAGQYMGSFFTQKDAAETLGIHQGYVSLQINGKISDAGGYKFRYATRAEINTVLELSEVVLKKGERP